MTGFRLCKNCKSAAFAARAPNIGDYYICGYDKSARKGNDICNIDSRLIKHKARGR